MIWIGIDPGSYETGIIVRDGDQLGWMAVIERGDPPKTFPGADYIEQVLDGIRCAARVVPLGVRYRIAVEGLTQPEPHMGLTNVRGIIGTGVVFGAVLAYYPEAVVVRPAGHGKGPRVAYPPQLWGAREKQGTGILRHARAAWDVAGSAATMEKIRSRSA